jgi:cytoskeleton protein RodZ
MALLQGGESPLAGGAAAPLPGPRSAGDLLRQRREALGLGLDDVAAALRIRPAYLRALEEGRPEGLPGPAYAIGFMRAYSEHLGLDSGEVLRRFKQEAILAAPPGLAFPMPLAERSMPGGGILLTGLILAVCSYSAWYYLTAGERTRPERVTEVPAALLAPRPEPAVLHPTEASAAPRIAALAEEPAPLPGTPQPVPDATAMPAPEGRFGGGTAPAQILIRATADSWIEIRDRARSVRLARVMKPGESYRVPEGAGLSLRTGNAGALEITVDGHPVPPLGRIGAVRRNVLLDPQALIAGTAVRD